MDKLRVAYAGHDFFSPCLRVLSGRDDIDIAMCLTSRSADYNQYVNRFAKSANIPVIQGTLNETSIAAFNLSRIDLLISAAYFYKIPIDDLSVRYAVNVRPSLLPDGRGSNPLPYYTSDHPEYCGVSIHEITSAVDRGPLLIQESIEVLNGESVDEIYLKISAVAPRLILTLITNIEDVFARRKAQTGGSYWPEHTDKERTIAASVAHTRDVLRMHRKFGMFGLIFHLQDGSVLQATQVVTNECSHEFTPGTIIGNIRNRHVIALQDGLVMIRA
jgi:methionyl-tRNA formyltransferase